MITFRIDAQSRREPSIRFVLRLLLAAYLINAGIVLVLAPWSALWDRNYFAHVVPWIGHWMSNSFVRGGVTGVGIVTAFAGVRDLAGVILARGTAPDAHPPVS